MPDDDFDRRLAHRLRRYEARLPDAGAPVPRAARRSGRWGWPVLAAGGAAVAVAAVVAVVWVSNLPSPSIGDAAPSATLQPTLTPSPSPTPQPSVTPTPDPTAAPTPVPPPGWTFVDIGFRVSDIAERDGHLVAVGYGSSSGVGVIAESDDGLSWREVDLTPLALGEGAIAAIEAGDSGFVAYGSRYVASPDPGYPYPVAEPFLLWSANGAVWEEVGAPDPCSFVDRESLVYGEFGFTMIGGRCRTEGDFDPRPIRIITSPNGRTWTTRTDIAEFAERTPHALATDGRRLVTVQSGHRSDESLEWLWLSDDGGATWRILDTAIPEEIALSGVTFGHGVWIARGSWLLEPRQDAESATCISGDGESWQCSVAEARVGSVEATTTGFVGLDIRLPDRFTAAPNEVAVVTSSDGVGWSERIEPALYNLLVRGVFPTSHGTIVVAITNPGTDDVAEQRMAVHRAPLP